MSLPLANSGKTAGGKRNAYKTEIHAPHNSRGESSPRQGPGLQGRSDSFQVSARSNLGLNTATRRVTRDPSLSSTRGPVGNAASRAPLTPPVGPGQLQNAWDPEQRKRVHSAQKLLKLPSGESRAWSQAGGSAPGLRPCDGQFTGKSSAARAARTRNCHDAGLCLLTSDVNLPNSLEE